MLYTIIVKPTTMNAVLISIVSALLCLVGAALATNPTFAQICSDPGVYQRGSQKSCGKYFICFNGQALQRACPRNMEFDKATLSCLPIGQAKCQIDFCLGTNPFGVTMVPNPDECGKYYACSSGVTTRMQCPSGLLFNSKIGSCDLADHVSCKLDNEDFIDYEPRIKCPSKGVAKYANPDDCSQYSICINGKRADYKCTNELHFDARTMRCNVAAKARCFK